MKCPSFWLGVCLIAEGTAFGLAGWAMTGRAASATEDVPAAVLAAEQQRMESMDRAVRAAVCVFSADGKGGGSGVVVTPDGYALTNYHVVQPCGNHMKCGMADGRIYDAVLVGIDPTGDVALIKLLGRDDFPTAELGDSDAVRAGDWCFAVGNPFLLATNLQPSVSYGIVSGTHRYQYPAGTLLEYADCIQTDAAINPGNSGGPLFDASGQLIGINGRGSFEKRGRVNVGVGYAISINQIKLFLGQLRSGRIVDHATLGATVTTDDRGRVVVSNILASSDAYRRGLQYGDELLAFGGRRITTVNGFKNALGIYPQGWRVPLSFQRGGQRFDTQVRLSGVHSPEELWASVQGRPKPEDGPAPKPRPEQPPEPQPQDPAPPPPPHPVTEPPQPPVPPEIAALIEVRRGYANYYFNRLHRDRVWKQFTERGDFRDRTGRWLLGGDAADSKLQIELATDTVFGRFPDGPARVDPSAELGSQLQPLGSGGLLVALHLWQRLLTLGPEKYGEVYYLGEAPLLDKPGLYDVLVATHDVTECHFYFETSTGRMVALEMFPDADADPCELYFSDFRDVDGRELPHQLDVVYGEQRYAEIRLTELQLDVSNRASPPAEN